MTKRTKKAKLGECCEAMKLVLSRARPNDRLGLMIETMYSMTAATKPRDVIVVRCHKSKDRKAPHADAAYCVVGFCPFCGEAVPCG